MNELNSKYQYNVNLKAVRSCCVGALSSQLSTNISGVSVSQDQWSKAHDPTSAGEKERMQPGFNSRRHVKGILTLSRVGRHRPSSTMK